MSGAPARPSDGFDPVWASRAALPRDGARETAALAGKRVLVTGAGGSIGSALCERLVTLDPASLIALDAAEGNLHELLLLLEAVPRKAPVVPVLADLRQGSALERCLASHAPDIVFHAAAFKHVPFLESQPWAVVENNVVATWRLLEAAARHGTGRLVALSTDKAVAPGSVMGRSKRLVELMVLGSSEAPPRPTAVRLGNVWGSRGSVVPRLRAQGLRGDALSVTDPEARRYFLSHEEAVTLLLSALWVGSGGDVLVPDLGRPLTMRELAGHVAGGEGEPRALRVTGLRPGERREESLLAAVDVVEDAPPPWSKRVIGPRPSRASLEAWLRVLSSCADAGDDGVSARRLRESVAALEASSGAAPGPDRPQQ